MNTWLRLTLVLFMVGGGFAGLTVTLVALLNHSAVQGSFTFLIAGILTFALASCGGLLFVLDYRHTRLMQITLAAQMVQISSPIGVYKFLTGVGFYLLFSSGQIEPQWGRISEHLDWWVDIGARWTVAGAQSRPWNINLNLIAVLLFVLLRHTAKSRNFV